MRYLELTLSGRVQGVGLRAFITGEARRRQLGGWVRNEEDGTVRVRLEGDVGMMEDFARDLGVLHDPLGPDVRAVRIERGGELERPPRPFALSL